VLKLIHGRAALLTALAMFLPGATLLQAATEESKDFDSAAKPQFRELPPEADIDRDYLRADELQEDPAITIRARPNVTMHDYSVNGNTYMIRVEPKHAPAYYLVDANGSGQFGWRRGEANADLLIPSWAVATW
jgi:hypothetical protein